MSSSGKRVAAGIVGRPVEVKGVVRWRAHVEGCRFATEGVAPITSLIQSLGHDAVLDLIERGHVVACQHCQPVLVEHEATR